MIYLGADHAGFQLKEQVKTYLESLSLEVKDLGARELNPDDDYPEIIFAVAQKVAGHPESRGIVFGGSGQGEAIVANKVKGIRAAVYYGGDAEIVKLSRQHNDANILSLGARFISFKQAQQALRLWLQTEFEGGRHHRRMQEIKEIEEHNVKCQSSNAK
ncbi:MAG: RpiB/LacA/LacB family sugar-phosphate isomerase [Candidatus Wildermuthbacteria bacterium]|nr:RpiB/LacA/LacB family sugar-phosphate isomerase [Candidatus Wildermuthbacteria bacterium]